MCKKSESITNIAVALVKFNNEVSKIGKDSANPHFKNKYASLDNIIDEIRPILTKHGLSILQMPGGDGEKFSMTTMLIHESGEWIESQPIVMRPVKNDPQGIGSCTTYARRYSLSAFLSLNTGEDDDGNDATHIQPPVQQPKPSQPSPSQPTSQTPVTNQSTTPSELISDAQIGFCKKIMKEKDISGELYIEMIKKYGVTSTKSLTKLQASKFIKELQDYVPDTKPIEISDDDLPF